MLRLASLYQYLVHRARARRRCVSIYEIVLASGSSSTRARNDHTLYTTACHCVSLRDGSMKKAVSCQL